MERTAWSDERIDDAVAEFRVDMREMRRELSQLKLFMLGQTVAILGAILPLYLR